MSKTKNTKKKPKKTQKISRFTYQTYYSQVSILNTYFIKKPYRNNVPSKHIKQYTKYVLINNLYLLRI